MKSGELGFEGLDLELVGSGGKVVSNARTDFDGFFLFERVPYGHYLLKVSAAAAKAAKISTDLGISLDVTPERPVVRLGSLRPRQDRELATAAAGAAAGNPKSR
jgi:hypothetical protein